MKLPIFACMASALLLADCGGGASSSPQPASTPGSSISTQAVSGTLTIGNPGSTVSSTARSPAFVSTGTKHVALFIDSAAAPAGQTSTCSPSTGSGTGCTITWAAQLTVPASHVFAVEADSGTNAPANTVLSVGSGSYAIVAGSANALTGLSLNGIATAFNAVVNSCSGVSPNSSCIGQMAILDATHYSILYGGATAVPTVGNSPTSGNVFDNGVVTFVSSASSIGTITGTAQPPFTSLAAGVLTVAGVEPSAQGAYLYAVTCGSGTSGTFGITAGGGATADAILTAPELAGLSPAVTFPASGLTSIYGAVSFTCTGGNITSAGGSLIVN